MNRLLTRVNRRTTTGGAAFLLGTAYLLSRLLGLLRDRMLVSHFGVSPLTDAYTAAFRIPDLLFTLLVSGALSVALIPVLSEHWGKGEKEQTWEVASSIINFLAIITAVAAVVIFIFARPIVTLITPGFDAYRHGLAVDMTRIMLVTPLLFAVSSVIGSIGQTFGRFFFFSAAGIFYNLGIIAGIVWLSPHLGISGVAWGVVLGTLVQGLIQLLGIVGLGYRWRPTLKLRNRSVREVIKLMVPRSIDQGIDQLNYMVETVIGSRLAAGSLSAYYYANNLKNVPLMLFGSTVATAAFPHLAARAASGDKTKVVEDFVLNMRTILFLVLPAATLTFLMRGYIVRLLFGFGNQVTADTLGFFAGTVLFQSLFFMVARVYYALKDTRTPLYVSIFAIAGNIVLSLVISKYLGVKGLALSQSVVAAAEVAVLMLILHKKLGSVGLNSIWHGAARMVIANSFMGICVYGVISRVAPLYKLDRGFAVIGPKFALISLVALAAYLIPAYLLNLKEAKFFLSKVKAVFMRPLKLELS